MKQAEFEMEDFDSWRLPACKEAQSKRAVSSGVHCGPKLSSAWCAGQLWATLYWGGVEKAKQIYL